MEQPPLQLPLMETAMNANYRNGLNHAAATEVPEPSSNGANGPLRQPADAPSANGDFGAGETGGAGPLPMGNGANGRDAHGRFAKGNPGGPGNPFARRTAQLRRVLSEAVTDEDVEAIAKRLLEQAKAGDVAAARLLLSYAIGQPTRAVDPDTLDRQEWAVFQQIPVPAPEVGRLLHDLPVEVACKMARALVPHLGAIAAQKVKEGLEEPGKKDEKARNEGKKQKKKKAAATAALHRHPAPGFGREAAETSKPQNLQLRPLTDFNDFAGELGFSSARETL
jgi:hypothetical protein